MHALDTADAILDDLVPHTRLAEARRIRPRFATAADYLAELVRRACLTPLQARWLARGRSPVVGPFAVLDRLGRGGSASVFLAHHRRMRRVVALKLLRPKDDRARARFGREAAALGALDHPHVVHAYDAGEDRGLLWLAMEYVPGPDLARLTREKGRLEARWACEYVRQAALGLQHVHDCGLVHRDVKPANLALTDDRRTVKVLDVGLAKHRVVADGNAGLTKPKVILGSLDYVAPEQAVDPRRAGPRADQYALGATLYHLLTGTVPFPGGHRTGKGLLRLLEEPVPVEQLRSDLPAGLPEVVRRLMARRPHDRFASADAAAAALAPFATIWVDDTAETVILGTAVHRPAEA
jgi:serine/threonine-protein kinase